MRQNVAFVVRYLGGLSPDELETIMRCGLALMPVTYSRRPGWVPSQEMGEEDGVKAVEQLKRLSLPRCTVWLDLEGCDGPPEWTAQWVNAWAQEIKAAGYEPGLYVGANPGGLDSAGLWKLKVVRYWRSCSRVPEPDNRGFCMFQLKPHNQAYGPLTVDFNALCEDWKGCRPTWVIDT